MRESFPNIETITGCEVTAQEKCYKFFTGNTLSLEGMIHVGQSYIPRFKVSGGDVRALNHAELFFGGFGGIVGHAESGKDNHGLLEQAPCTIAPTPFSETFTLCK